MISRRELMKWGAAGPALAALSKAALANGQQGLDALLVDDRFHAVNAPVLTRTEIWRFTGDVTPVWYDRLDMRWRQRGHVLGGITGADALFVLETLAHHRGRRVVSRKPLDLPQVSGVHAVSWIIAPVHTSVAA